MSESDNNPVKRFLYGTVGYAKVLGFMNGEREVGTSPVKFFNRTLMGSPNSSSRMVVKASNSDSLVRIPKVPKIMGMDEFPSGYSDSAKREVVKNKGHPSRSLTRRDLQYRIALDGRFHNWSANDIEEFLRERAQNVFSDMSFESKRKNGGKNYVITVETPDFELNMSAAVARNSQNYCDIGFNLEADEVRKLKGITDRLYYSPEFNPRVRENRGE